MDGDHPARPGQQERKNAGGVVHQLQLVVAGQPGDLELPHGQQPGQQPGAGQTHGFASILRLAGLQDGQLSP